MLTKKILLVIFLAFDLGNANISSMKKRLEELEESVNYAQREIVSTHKLQL